MKKKCLHCHRLSHIRRRGLCCRCTRAGLAKAYPRLREIGFVDFCGEAASPQPTKALPGTSEKIAILRQRAEQKLSLHHPEDPKLMPSPQMTTRTASLDPEIRLWVEAWENQLSQ